MEFKIKNINPFLDRKYALIGITITDIPTYNVLMVSKDENNLKIERSFETTDFKEIEKNINKNIPVLLSFSGKGILTKKTSTSGNYLKEILFNSAIENFYIYEVKQETNNFISIARKEVLLPFFNQFVENKFYVIDYSIGPFIGVALKKIINQSSYFSNSYLLKFKNDVFEEFENTTNIVKKYEFGDDHITNVDVPLISTLLNHLYESSKFIYEKSFLTINKQEYKYKKIFDTVAIFSLVFFLLSLVVSYIMLNYYNEKYINYDSQVYHLKETYNKLNQLEIEKENKEYILKESGVLNKNFVSYYAHKIGLSVPDQIILNKLYVNPILKKIKDNEKIQLNTEEILIEGITNSSLNLNEWIKSIKTEKWVSKIEILDFRNNKQNKGEFNLRISIQ